MVILIKIPEKGTLQVKVGQKVDFDTPLVKKKSQTEIKLPVSQKLNIDPKKIFSYLKKFIGDTVKKGEVIAQKKSFFSKQNYCSEFDGIVKEINHEEGCLIVKAYLDKDDTIKCYFRGEVVDIEKNEIKLKVNDGQEFDLKEASCDFGGETFFMELGADKVVEEKVKNKIVFFRSTSSYDQTKIEALGGAGFVSLYPLSQKTSLPHAILKQIDDWPKITNSTFSYCIINKKIIKFIFIHK